MSKLHRGRFLLIAGDPKDLALLVIDEGSIIDVADFGHISARMSELRECNLPFGGVPVLMLADFHQKPCVAGVSLNKALLLADLSPETLAELKINIGESSKKIMLSEFGADRKGVNLIRRFQRFNLTQQMRASKDPRHMARLDQLRDIFSEQPISEDILQSLQPLTQEAVDKHPELRFAKIVAMSWREIYPLTYLQILNFARVHNLPVVKWRKTLIGATAGYINDDETEELYKQEEVGLHEFFVKGIPGTFTENLDTQNGIVNGGKNIYESLTLEESEPDIQTHTDVAALKSENWVKGVLIVFLSVRPLSINVKVKVLQSQAESMAAKKYILKQTDLPEDSASRNKYVEVIVPIVLRSQSFSSTSYAPTSTWASQDMPRHFQAVTFDTIPDFACSDFKVQGTTENFLISSFGPRTFPPPITTCSFYVQYSRVMFGKTHYTMGLNKDDMDHLRKLKHNATLIIWEQSYDANGHWDASAAVAAAEKLLQQQHEMGKIKKKRKGSLKRGRTGAQDDDDDDDDDDDANDNGDARRGGEGMAEEGSDIGGDKGVPQIIIRGLTNIGNTCFANSALQALGSSKTFLHFVRKMKTLISVRTQNDPSLKGRSCLKVTEKIVELTGMLNQTMFSSSINIREIVALFPVELANRAIEHDAHELMVFLRDQIDQTNLLICDGEVHMLTTPFQGKY